MKNFSILFLIFFLSMTIFASNSYQQQNNQKSYALGFAIDYDFFSSIQINSEDLFSYGSPNRISFTVISNDFKFETQGMLIRASQSNETYDSSFILGDISFGGYSINMLTDNFNLYYGAKLGFVFSTSSSSDSSSNQELYSYYLTPSMGGEYFLVPNFSISGEVGLKVVIFDLEDNDRSEYYVYTTSSLLVKWYF